MNEPAKQAHVCSCGREFKSKRGLSVHRRSCKPKEDIVGNDAELSFSGQNHPPDGGNIIKAPSSSGNEAVAPEVDPFEAWVQENLRILSANDEALQAAVDELRGLLSTTREPSTTPQWVHGTGAEIQKATPEIIKTILDIGKNLTVGGGDDLFNFDPEFREYVKETLKTTLEARKKIVLRAVKDIEDGKLYYREAEVRGSNQKAIKNE